MGPKAQSEGGIPETMGFVGSFCYSRLFIVPYYTILYYTIPSHPILYYTILYYTILYYTILYYTILYYTILYYTILYHTILYYTILYYTILYYTILYYTILYYTILYYTILYYTILYYTILVLCGLLGYYWRTFKPRPSGPLLLLHLREGAVREERYARGLSPGPKIQAYWPPRRQTLGSKYPNIMV